MKSRILLPLGALLFVLGLAAQSADQIMANAIQKYFGFEYTAAINGLESVRPIFMQRNNVSQRLRCEYYLAMAYLENGDLEQGLTYVGEGWDLAASKYGEESAEVGDFLMAFGKYYQIMEVYDTAQMFYLGAEELKQKKPNELDFGELYANLAYAYDLGEKYDSAVYFYEKALPIMERQLGPYHVYTEWLYSSLAYPTSKSFQYEKEVKYTLKSLDITVRNRGKDSEDYLDALKAVGVAYGHLEDHENERIYFQQTREVARQLFGEKSTQYATALYNLGGVYSSLRQTDEAVTFAMQAYELRKKLLGEKDEKTLQALENIGNIYYDAGKYGEAKTYFEQYLAVVLKNFGKKSPELIDAYANMADVYENSGDYALAEDYLLKTLELRMQHRKHEIPDSYISLARVADERAQFDQAIDYLNQALQANSTYNAADPVTEAFVKNNIGIVYNGTGQFSKALAALSESLELRKRLFGLESKAVGQTYANIGTVYKDLGEYDNAKDMYTKAIEITRKVYGDKHPALARNYINLSAVLTGSELKDAIELLKEAEAILLAANGEWSPELRSVYNNLAATYWELVQYDKALEYQQKHKRLVEHVFGPVSDGMADNFNLLANIYYEMGQINLAIRAYHDALRIFEQLYQPDHLNMAMMYNNLGNAYMGLGESFQALSYLLEAKRIYEATLPSGHEDILMVQMNLALIEFQRSNYKRAQEIYEDVLQLGWDKPSPDSLFLATTYQNLGIALRMMEKLDESFEAYEKSVEIRNRVIGETQLLADLYQNMALVKRAQGNFSQAFTYIDRAKSILLKMPVKPKQSLTKVYWNLASFYTEEKKYQEALQALEQAVSMNKDDQGNDYNAVSAFNLAASKVDVNFLQYLQTKDPKFLSKASLLIHEASGALTTAEQAFLSEEDQTEFSIWKNVLTTIAARNALEQYKLTKDDKYLEEALYYSERSKSNVLVNALTQTKAKAFSGVDEALVTREREIKAHLQQLHHELFTLQSVPDEQEKVAGLRTQIFEQKKQLDEVTKSIKANPRYQRLAAGDNIVSLADIRKNLIKPGEAVVEYAASDSSLIVFLITDHEIKVFEKHYEEKFDSFVPALRNAIIYKSDAATEMLSSRMYDIAMRDVEAYLRAERTDVKTLTIVPAGPFNYFPFEALKRDGRFLIQDYNIRYAYSLSLANFLQTQPAATVKNSCLAFAPVFADEGTGKLTASARSLFDAARSVSTDESRGFSVNGDFISPLPGTEREVKQIDALLKSKQIGSEVFVFANAKEELIKQGIMKDYKYLHFATHGFVNEVNPEFSGIFLSQNQNSSEDCILFASEIYNLELNADLVTLSACETGLGKFAYGEGIVGLSRAFYYAGAKNLLVSQWKVSDESTARLMVDFYGNIVTGEDKATALRNAKIKLIESGEFAQPYYWAPFVLIGQ